MDNKFNKHLAEYKNLIMQGINYARNGSFEESKKIFLRAIARDAEKIEAYINLSNVHIINKNFSEATNVIEKYNKNYKYNTEILFYYWNVCSIYNLFDKFKKHLSDLESLDEKKFKNRHFLYFVIGKYYEKLENEKQAISYFNKSIRLNDKFEDAYINLFALLERTNKIQELEEKLNFYHENNNKITAKILFYKSLLFNRKQMYNESEEIIINHNLEYIFKENKNYYVNVLNLRSKNNEKINNYKIALSSIKKRNNFLKNLEENKLIKRDSFIETFKNFKKIYTKKNLEKITLSINKIKNKKNICFLVGFPRSGTTLLDSILRSHSKILVLEEKPFLPNARDKFFKSNKSNLDAILKINEKEILEIRDFYFDQVKSFYNIKDKIIIDKIPLTITELGFVKLIFPESKIILALRHPYDVVTSCFFTSFKQNKAMINFLDWNETISFYDSVFDLFEFYEDQIELDLIKIKYEDIVSNFNLEINKLLIFLKLNYEKNLPNFYKTAKDRKKISTPSYNQVVNPLYNSSINRWKNYKNLINFENKLSKWVKKFNYD